MKQMTDGNLITLKEILLDYFNNSNPHTNKLKVIDNKYREYYTGVTLNYITYDLLKAKYHKSDVAKVLLELQINSEIKSLRCPDVKNYVFEKTSHTGSYSRLSPVTGTYDSKYMPTEYNVHKYLKSFIKNE